MITTARRPPLPRALASLLAALALIGATRATRAQAALPSAPAPHAPGEPTATKRAPQPTHVLHAERLFNEAVRAMDAGDYPRACPLLEQSQSLDQSSGTLLNLGDCYEHLDRTASAWRTFSEARALALATNRPDRAQVAEARLVRLVPRLRQLMILPPPRSGADLVVYLNDQLLAALGANTPLPVDPGMQRVRARAAGMRDYVVEVAAPQPGTTTALQIPALSPGQTTLSDGTVTAPTGEALVLDGQQIGAIACAGVGVVGVVTGTVFGLHSRSRHRDSDLYFDGARCTDRRCEELMNDARAAGNVSTVSFVLGGVGLAAGAVLWFARPFGESNGVRAAVSVGPGAIQFVGRW